MKLSVVDQSPVPEGYTPADALNNTIELARLADRLGYERYWLAEHHGMECFSGPCPEILMARIAAETQTIRVGSGGIMLSHYSPYKVAETFRMLHALYPGRIDLGVGRAPGGSPLESYALQRDRSQRFSVADDFVEQLLELRALLNKDIPAGHQFSKLRVSPEMPGKPDLWLLGSSPWSAQAAAQLGLPYAFAHFIETQYTRQSIEYYQANFKPSADLAAPKVILALGVVCAETEAEVERVFASTRLFGRHIRTGNRGPVPTSEQAMRELGDGFDPMRMLSSDWPRYIAGTPDQVHSKLTEIATALNIDELMVITVVHDHAARMRSYELLADAFGLQARS